MGLWKKEARREIALGQNFGFFSLVGKNRGLVILLGEWLWTFRENRAWAPLEKII